MPDRWRAAVVLMASTGLRLGECLGLTVDRVDFLRRTIRIDRQLVNTTGGATFGTPKTRSGIRDIPVPESVVEMLAANLAEFAAGMRGWSSRLGRVARCRGRTGRIATAQLVSPSASKAELGRMI